MNNRVSMLGFRITERKAALLIEKLSFQLVGVFLVFSIFGIKILSVIGAVIWFLLSEIIWHMHPKTQKEESVSIFIAGLLILYLSSIIPKFSNGLNALQLQHIRLILIATVLLLFTLGAVRVVWKLSAHTASISFIFSISSMLGYTALSLFSLVLIPVVAWCRIKLRRHDWLQVIFGIIVGISIPMMVVVYF